MTELSLLTFVLVTLAAARITRAVNVDDVGKPVRMRLMRIGLALDDALHRRDPTRTSPAVRYRWHTHGETLGLCAWCFGFWVSVFATLALAGLSEHVVQWLAAPWALSWIVGLLDAIVDALHGHGDE